MRTVAGAYADNEADLGAYPESARRKGKLGEESPMQDVIGIATLVAVAVGFRLYLHSTVFVSFSWHGVIRVFSFSVIASWVLLATSVVWCLFAALAFAIRPR